MRYLEIRMAIVQYGRSVHCILVSFVSHETQAVVYEFYLIENVFVVTQTVGTESLILWGIKIV